MQVFSGCYATFVWLLGIAIADGPASESTVVEDLSVPKRQQTLSAKKVCHLSLCISKFSTLPYAYDLKIPSIFFCRRW